MRGGRVVRIDTHGLDVQIEAGKISGLLDKKGGLFRRQAGQDRHGEEQSLVVVLEKLFLIQDLGRQQGGRDDREQVADGLIAGFPPQLDDLLAGQPRVGSGLFEFGQHSAFGVAVSSLEKGAQFIEVEIHIIAGTIFRQDNAIGIEHSIKRPASLQPSRPWEKRREDMAEG